MCEQFNKQVQQESIPKYDFTVLRNRLSVNYDNFVGFMPKDGHYQSKDLPPNPSHHGKHIYNMQFKENYDEKGIKNFACFFKYQSDGPPGPVVLLDRDRRRNNNEFETFEIHWSRPDSRGSDIEFYMVRTYHNQV